MLGCSNQHAGGDDEPEPVTPGSFSAPAPTPTVVIDVTKPPIAVYGNIIPLKDAYYLNLNDLNPDHTSTWIPFLSIDDRWGTVQKFMDQVGRSPRVYATGYMVDRTFVVCGLSLNETNERFPKGLTITDACPKG